MNTRRSIVLLSILLAALWWLVDGTLDYLYFFEGPWLELVFTGPSGHETYIRLAGAAFIVVFGFVASKMAGAVQEREAKLEEEERRYRTLYNGIRDAVAVTDEQRRIIHCNQAFVELFGYELSELEGRHTRILYPTDEACEKVGEEIRRYGGGGFFYEATFQTKDGRVFPGETTIQFVESDGGQIRVCVVRDVSERHKAQERVAHLNAVLRAIRNVNQLITRVRDRAELIDAVCAELVETRGFLSAWITLFDAEGGLVASAQRGLEAVFGGFQEDLRQGRPPKCVQAILEEPRPVHVHAQEDCAGCPLAAETEDALGVTARLAYGEGHHGVLGVTVPAETLQEEEELLLIEEVAADIAFALGDIELERRRAEAEDALERSEEQYRLLAESALDVICIHDMSGVIQYVNESAARMMGRQPQEVIGQDVTQFVAPEYAGQLRSRRDARDGGEARPALYEVEVMAAGGRRVPLEVNSTPLVRDGEIWGLLLVGRDLTERRRMEQALRRNEARFRRIFEQSPAGIAIVEPESTAIRDANPSLLAMAGMEELTPGARLDALIQDCEGGRLTAERECSEQECRLIRDDGEERVVRLSCAPWRGVESEAPLALVNLVDVTEHARLEEQLRQAQKMEAIGQLAGGVAHDFNNLLQVIGGNIDLACQDLAEEHPVAENLDNAMGAAERATTLVRQLLAFSRRQILDPRHLDVNEVVADLLKMMRRTLGEHIELSFRPAEPLARVYADRGQLEQVLMNLCVNARDAMPAGGELLIETAATDIDPGYAESHLGTLAGPHVTLTVTDTGCGMDEATRRQVFDPFFSTKEVGKGTGLGLATVYGIVKQHDGLVNIYSELGQGTTVKVYLPASENAGEEAETAEAREVRGGSETILVAEDDESLLQLARTILERAGYTVLEARDGADAMAVVEERAGEIDLMLADVVMPKYDGRQVAERLRTLEPDARTVFMSGYSANSIHTGFVLDEGVELLQKPYSANALLVRVREVLDA